MNLKGIPFHFPQSVLLFFQELRKTKASRTSLEKAVLTAKEVFRKGMIHGGQSSTYMDLRGCNLGRSSGSLDLALNLVLKTEPDLQRASSLLPKYITLFVLDVSPN